MPARLSFPNDPIFSITDCRSSSVISSSKIYDWLINLASGFLPISSTISSSSLSLFKELIRLVILEGIFSNKLFRSLSLALLVFFLSIIFGSLNHFNEKFMNPIIIG